MSLIVYPTDGNNEFKIEEYMDKVFYISETTVEWATVPLVHYQKKSGLAREIRTGILMEIASSKFLITAAHNMKKNFEEGDILQMLLPGKGRIPVPMIREWFWSTVDPQEDICVCKLHEDTVASMGEGFRFLHLTQLMLKKNPSHRKGFYLLVGYPRDMLRPDEDGVKRADTWKYITTPYFRDFKNIENYDENFHLIVDYNRETTNKEGATVHPPGLSGCGVYFLGNPTTHPLLEHEGLKLASIQTSWHRGHEYAKTTWIDVVLSIIWKYYPQCRGPMALHGPDFCF